MRLDSRNISVSLISWRIFLAPSYLSLHMATISCPFLISPLQIHPFSFLVLFLFLSRSLCSSLSPSLRYHISTTFSSSFPFHSSPLPLSTHLSSLPSTPPFSSLFSYPVASSTVFQLSNERWNLIFEEGLKMWGNNALLTEASFEGVLLILCSHGTHFFTGQLRVWRDFLIVERTFMHACTCQG